MPTPKMLPDEDSVLLRHRDFEGLTLTEVAKKYGVTKGAVSHRFTRMGRPWGKDAPVDYQDYLPWKILRDHQSLDAALRLKSHIRWRTGHPLTDAQSRRLTNWHSRIAREDVTVLYEPEQSTPWIYLPRQSSDDSLIIRWPADIAPPTDAQRAVLLLPKGPELAERQLRLTQSS